MRTLWESGLERVWAGVTSIEELVRVLGERVHEDGSSSFDPASVGVVPAPAPEAAPRAVAATAAAGAQPTATAEPSAAESAGQRLLVADDDPQMRRLIRGVLQREGYVVDEANDGLDTLDAIERGGIDLVILDYDMPRLDGLGVLEELRAQVRTATLPVIMLTARNDEIEEKALDLGAQDYLTKPVQTRSLIARVKAVLKRADT
jgi:CheY-like chemotaxis protein